MKNTLTTLAAGLVLAGLAVGCNTAPTNTNANGNTVPANTAVVTNNNGNTNTSGVQTTNTSNRPGDMMAGNYNANMTRADYDKDKDRYAGEAKTAGRTIGTGANDGWLWTKTRMALATTAGLRETTINVDVSNAVVTLTGTVGTKEQLTMAVKTAQEIDGVTSVKNNLKVSAGDSMTNQMTGSNSNMKSNVNR